MQGGVGGGAYQGAAYPMVPFGHTRRGRFGKELMSRCRVRVRPLLRPARAGLGSPTSRETDPGPDLQTRSRDVGNDKLSEVAPGPPLTEGSRWRQQLAIWLNPSRI